MPRTKFAKVYPYSPSELEIIKKDLSLFEINLKRELNIKSKRSLAQVQLMKNSLKLILILKGFFSKNGKFLDNANEIITEKDIYGIDNKINLLLNAIKNDVADISLFISAVDLTSLIAELQKTRENDGRSAINFVKNFCNVIKSPENMATIPAPALEVNNIPAKLFNYNELLPAIINEVDKILDKLKALSFGWYKIPATIFAFNHFKGWANSTQKNAMLIPRNELQKLRALLFESTEISNRLSAGEPFNAIMQEVEVDDIITMMHDLIYTPIPGITNHSPSVSSLIQEVESLSPTDTLSEPVPPLIAPVTLKRKFPSIDIEREKLLSPRKQSRQQPINDAAPRPLLPYVSVAESQMMEVAPTTPALFPSNPEDKRKSAYYRSVGPKINQAIRSNLNRDDIQAELQYSKPKTWALLDAKLRSAHCTLSKRKPSPSLTQAWLDLKAIKKYFAPRRSSATPEEMELISELVQHMAIDQGINSFIDKAKQLFPSAILSTPAPLAQRHIDGELQNSKPKTWALLYAKLRSAHCTLLNREESPSLTQAWADLKAIKKYFALRRSSATPQEMELISELVEHITIDRGINSFITKAKELFPSAILSTPAQPAQPYSSKRLRLDK